MKTQQYHFVNNEMKNIFTAPGFDPVQAQLVLIFGEPSLITDASFFNNINGLFPQALIVSSSTAGEIMNDDVFDDSVVITAIEFEKTTLKYSVARAEQFGDSYATGEYLMKQLQADDLVTVFVLADGTRFNGSEMAEGFNNNNPLHVPVTGGLAGDGTRFLQTFVGAGALPEQGVAAAIGFYGNNLTVGHGSFGGWDEFGPEKTITRSERNIVYEIDGKNAVDLYNEYLGHVKDELPLNALLFPLAVKRAGSDQDVIRTILHMDENAKTMQVGGNLEVGSTVRFMKANFDRLIEGSSMAAKSAFTKFAEREPQLAILISCVGRKLILQKRSDEEVLAAKEIIGNTVPLAGFYSYGEFSPLNASTQCELHNQTMTITTFSES